MISGVKSTLFPYNDALRSIQKGFEFVEGGGDGGTLRGVIQIGKEG